MDGKGRRRLQKYGIKDKEIPKRLKLKPPKEPWLKDRAEREARWEEEDKKKRFEELAQADRAYKRERAYMEEIRKLSLGNSFEECVRMMSDEGLELALFAYGLMRCHKEEYRGCVVDLKAKIWACEYLTDRGWGKATTNIKIEKVRGISEEGLKKEIEILEQRIKNADYHVVDEKPESLGSAEVSGLAEGNGTAGEDQSDSSVQTLPVPAEVPQ